MSQVPLRWTLPLRLLHGRRARECILAARAAAKRLSRTGKPPAQERDPSQRRLAPLSQQRRGDLWLLPAVKRGAIWTDNDLLNNLCAFPPRIVRVVLLSFAGLVRAKERID